MIKKGVLNFFKNLKYFFTPLGAIALGAVFGLSVLIPGLIEAFKVLLENVVEITGNTSIDLNVLKDTVYDAVFDLDWNNPFESVRTVLSYDWLTDTFNDCLNTLMGEAEQYTQSVGEAVSSCLNQVVYLFGIFVSFTFLGFLGGFYLTKWLVRRNIAKRSIWKYILASFIDGLLALALMFICGVLASFWSASIIISVFFVILIFGATQLIEAYFLRAYKLVPFRAIVNFKNILKQILVAVIIFVITFALIVIAILITNAVVGLFIGIALVEIAFIVISMNTEGYVIDVVNEIAINKLT